MKHMTVVLILGLASLLPIAHPAAAQSPAVTASEVVDAETLKAFVEGAKARIEEIDEAKQLLTPFISSLAGRRRLEAREHIPHAHERRRDRFVSSGDDADAGDKNIYALEDDRGNTVVQDLIAAADADGHVEYYWDDPAQEGDEDTPKIAYATRFTGQAYGNTVILIGGYYQDLSQSHRPCTTSRSFRLRR